MDTITLLIAIWGAITGTIGLILKALDFKEAKPNLKFELDKTKTSFYTDVSNINWDNIHYSGNWDSAIINVVIKNKGRQPVTISNIEAKEYFSIGNNNPKYHWRDVNLMRNTLVRFIKKNDKDQVTTWLNLKYANTAELPLRMEAFESKSIRITVPFVDKSLSKGHTLKCFLKFISVDKEYKFNFSVPEIRQVVPNLNEYTRS